LALLDFYERAREALLQMRETSSVLRRGNLGAEGKKTNLLAVELLRVFLLRLRALD